MTRLTRFSMALFTVVLMAQLSWAAESVRVKVERANLRSAPSTDSRIVEKVSKGAILQVLGREGGWIHVTAPSSGAAAYISASLCEPVPSAAPVVSQPVVPEPPPVTTTVESPSEDEPRQFGAHLSWASRSVGFGLGVRASTGIPLEAVPGLGALVTFDYLFRPGHATGDSEGDFNGHFLKLGVYPTYSREVRGVVKAYAGVGLSYLRRSWSLDTPEAEEGAEPAAEELSEGSGSETSLGILAGVKFKERYFGEIRYHFGDVHHVTVSAGVLFDSPW